MPLPPPPPVTPGASTLLGRILAAGYAPDERRDRLDVSWCCCTVCCCWVRLGREAGGGSPREERRERSAERLFASLSAEPREARRDSTLDTGKDEERGAVWGREGEEPDAGRPSGWESSGSDLDAK